ncbi:MULTISPECIES: aconitate hydratase AcnA [unclassified Achromobacter]|uniref:aconitate hydratase AcnA n=1 Tax=unclassified Achromobacter TaxID=2626865 RepID=UPI000B51A424|nr:MULTISPECIES: aconitate hydratase AcnA [unclassified Achromobacter]OWT77097.1 aconitate hydratase 1 [Achromobacter sp. HZ28]OWT77978.1 aconitate hydratase 1 [Achromobacter sp. HZ34]
MKNSNDQAPAAADLALSGATVRFVDLAAAAQAAGRDLADYPYVVRVLLENLLRHRAWGDAIASEEIDALWEWSTHTAADLPLYVARVILPDSSGLPVLQDLAALRDAVALAGGDPARVDTHIPVDLIVDHSLQVDHWGDAQAVTLNLRREYQRNDERYRFLKWAQQAFRGVRVFPPGTGIIHQVNLEYAAPVIATTQRPDGLWAYPDFVIGGDSHTPMINALGVLGWGVGGIDAEAALLGEAYTFPVPEVVGVRLSGSIRPPALTTDAALLVTQRLRREGVAGCMVEFFGSAVAGLSVPERATLANMAPEYGATCGFFPIDDRTLEYLRASGRTEAQLELIAAYAHANGFFRQSDAHPPKYGRIIDIDLGEATPSIAGPSRPQDRLTLPEVPADFHARLTRAKEEGGFGVAGSPAGSAVHAAAAASTPAAAAAPLVRNASAAATLGHGSVTLAAITSCTNTSNPAVMLAAGLLARNALRRGLMPPAWVKRSLAPGSRAVTQYLERAGLLAELEALGFYVIGYGCTTCGGKSGPLDADAAERIGEDGLVAVAVLSGNRNFEGRIHKLLRANYIGSPPMVVAYALAARIDIDFENEALGQDADGASVYLRDIWPSQEDIDAVLPVAADRALYEAVYDPAKVRSKDWDALPASSGLRFEWDPKSLYLVEPPFFRDVPAGDALVGLQADLRDCRVLAAFADSLTTDHISPGGEIPLDTPAGQYLTQNGVAQRDFNSYVARRCNYHVMTRATFANLRVHNELIPGSEGGVTRHFPDGAQMTIYDAAMLYRKSGQASIILAGKEYGTGSSRDWAAKGSALLGVRAVIAESYERIHRANLVGMGVLPLAFEKGQGWRALGLTGSESFSFEGIEAGVLQGKPIEVTATDGERIVHFTVRAQVLTQAERLLMAAGGIPAKVLSDMLKEVPA